MNERAVSMEHLWALLTISLMCRVGDKSSLSTIPRSRVCGTTGSSLFPRYRQLQTKTFAHCSKLSTITNKWSEFIVMKMSNKQNIVSWKCRSLSLAACVSKFCSEGLDTSRQSTVTFHQSLLDVTVTVHCSKSCEVVTLIVTPRWQCRTIFKEIPLGIDWCSWHRHRGTTTRAVFDSFFSDS